MGRLKNSLSKRINVESSELISLLIAPAESVTDEINSHHLQGGADGVASCHPSMSVRMLREFPHLRSL